MDKARAIERIKKCFALSKSANANEAAAAMRQAQKLMEMFDLEEKDVLHSEWAQKAVDCPIQVNKKPPLVLMGLVNLVKAAFTVEGIFEATMRVSDRSYTVRYFGLETRVEMASYAHVVIFRAMEKAWKEHLSENLYLKAHKGARQSFQLGFLRAIKEKVEAIGFTDEEQAIVNAMTTRHYGQSVEKIEKKGSGAINSLLRAGRDAAADFEINRPMNAEKLRLS